MSENYDNRYFPFTPYHPYDPWFTNLKLYLFGESISENLHRLDVKKAVFLAPKVYALITDDNKLVIKVKGVTQEYLKDISFYDLEKLLIKDSSMEFNQEKWFKNVIKGNITTKELAYTLKATNIKRNAVYSNIDGTLIYTNTKPINYDEIINND